MKISISNGTILRVFLWMALFYGLFFMRELLLIILVSLLIASVLDPIVTHFQKYKVPRVLSVAGLYTIFFGAMITLIVFILPQLADETSKFIKALPSIINSFTIAGRDFGLGDISVYFSELAKQIDKGQILTITKNFVVGAGSVAQTTGLFLNKILNLFLIIVFSFYLAVQESGVPNFLKLITPKSYTQYILDLWRRSQIKISGWGKGQVIVALIVSVLIYIPLKIIGMPYATLFSVMAFAGEMIPVVGLITASIPAIVTAYFFKDLNFSLLIAFIYFVVMQLENYVIYPKVMNKLLGVPPIIILMAVIVGAKVAGFWGIVLSVPMAAVMMEFVRDVLDEKLPNHEIK